MLAHTSLQLHVLVHGCMLCAVAKTLPAAAYSDACLMLTRTSLCILYVLLHGMHALCCSQKLARVCDPIGILLHEEAYSQQRCSSLHSTFTAQLLLL